MVVVVVVNNISSVTQYPASQPNRVILSPARHVWSYLGCQRLFMCGFRFWLHEILLSSMLKASNKKFHAMSDQLTRVGKAPQTVSQLRSDLVSYLRSNPTTPDGIHYREFINHGGWDSYLRRMSMDGKWGDWIALWGLTNMLIIPVALISSLGEAGLKIINPNAR